MRCTLENWLGLLASAAKDQIDQGENQDWIRHDLKYAMKDISNLDFRWSPTFRDALDNCSKSPHINLIYCHIDKWLRKYHSILDTTKH